MSRQAFGDLTDYFAEGLDLPIGGVVYTIPEPSAATGVYLQAMWTGASAAFMAEAGVPEDQLPTVGAAEVKVMLDDDEETNLYRRILGGALYDRMLADGLSWRKIKHCALTGFYWIVVGEDVALRYWQGLPLQDTPTNRADRRRATRAPSTRTAAATTTQSQNSGSGTKRQPTKSAKPRATKAAPSRGSKS